MFKSLFKKVEKEVVPVKELVATPDNIINSKVVQKSFDEELSEIINSLELTGKRNLEIEELEDRIKKFRLDNDELISSTNKLKEVGLINTPSVAQTLREFENEIHVKEGQIKQIKFDIKEKKKMNEMISHYNLKFPGYKFIPKKEFLKVLEKYNLVMGEASMYCKEIPKKAVDIVHGFRGYIKDNTVNFYWEGDIRKVYTEDFLKNNLEKVKKPWGEMDEWERRTSMLFPMETSNYSVILEKGPNLSLTPLKMVAPKDHFTIPTMDFSDYVRKSRRGSFAFSSQAEEYERVLEESKNINICKMDGNIITYDFSKAQKTLGEFKKVLDPIALLMVNDFGYNNVKKLNDVAEAQHSFDGVIILDAWDEEANIPEIKNENWN